MKNVYVGIKFLKTQAKMWFLASREINKIACTHCLFVEMFKQVTGGEREY